MLGWANSKFARFFPPPSSVGRFFLCAKLALYFCIHFCDHDSIMYKTRSIVIRHYERISFHRHYYQRVQLHISAVCPGLNWIFARIFLEFRLTEMRFQSSGLRGIRLTSKVAYSSAELKTQHSALKFQLVNGILKIESNFPEYFWISVSWKNDAIFSA